jgi:uncharacterized membrane protein (Fun14 family)
MGARKSKKIETHLLNIWREKFHKEMVSLSNLLTPLVGEIGIGGVGGFLSGWALKKAAKIMAFIIGLAFLGLQYLAYEDIIKIDYGALQEWANGLVGQASGAQNLLADFIVHAPFASAFIGGFYLGLQRG